MSGERHDLGGGYSFEFYRWDPDLELNPQYEHLRGRLPVERAGIILRCPHGEGGVPFKSDVVPRDGQEGWTVESLDPLTLSPSIHRLECGCHGHIRDGRWEPA